MEKTKNQKGKKKHMTILFSVLGGLISLVAVYVITGLYVTLPTKGESIARYNNPKSALLVVDMQNDITKDNSYGNTSKFVESVNQAIRIAEESEIEIIYIKNIYGNNPIVSLLAGGKGKQGTEGIEFDNRLNVVNSNIFTKSRGDSFSVKGFEDYLISNQVDTLYIAGADAAGCVLRTAQGGKNRNYDVTIIKDAVASLVSDAKMMQVEEQYKKSGIKTITRKEFEK